MFREDVVTDQREERAEAVAAVPAVFAPQVRGAAGLEDGVLRVEQLLGGQLAEGRGGGFDAQAAGDDLGQPVELRAPAHHVRVSTLDDRAPEEPGGER